MADQDGQTGNLSDPVEKELNIQLGLVETVQNLKARVLHLETLEGGGEQIILDINVTTIDVLNTAVETSIYTFSIPGGTLSTGNAIHLYEEGQIANSSGGAKTITIRYKYGGITILTDSISIPNGVVTVPQFLDMHMFADAATNAQKGQFFGIYNDNNLAELGADQGAAAVDSTVAQTFDVTVQWSAAGPANIRLRKQEAVLKHYVAP